MLFPVSFDSIAVLKHSRTMVAFGSSMIRLPSGCLGYRSFPLLSLMFFLYPYDALYGVIPCSYLPLCM